MIKHKSEDYKLSAVKYFLENKDTQENTCKIFKCYVRSLFRWIKRYEEEKEIKRHNREPILYKVKKEHIKFILEELKNNKTITIEDLLTKLKTKFKTLTLSKTHLHRIIKENYISLKLTKIRHEPIKRFGKDINIKEKIKQFYNEIKNYNIDDVICIDETSINSLQLRHHCYNDVGKRCVIKTNSQEVFKKYTGIFAISVNGVEGYELYNKGGIDGDRLLAFLEKFLTNKYKNKVIILDNASSHRNERVKELINKNNKLIYSVPYQHYTNSIEMFFSLLKSKLQKKQGLLYEDLNNNIKDVIKTIPKEYYKKLLNGTYNRQTDYIKKNKVRKYKEYKI
jgi:transposase-like protein